MQDDSRKTQPDLAAPRRPLQILLWMGLLVVIVGTARALTIPAIGEIRPAPTATLPQHVARAAVTPAAGGDASVPSASDVFRNSDAADTDQPPPTF
jgi:type II secretory pathway component PulM